MMQSNREGTGSPAGPVAVERQGATAWVTIARPEKLNALNQEALEALGAAFAELRPDAAAFRLRAVVLTGAGDKAFVAGADIAELARLDPARARELSRSTGELFGAIERFPVPVIAAINGYALGGGLEMALACSLRVAAEHARLGLPEVKLGLIPGYGGTQRLPRLIGEGAALEILLTGEPVEAREALRMGLVNRVVPAAQLRPAAQALADTIAARAPLAVQLAQQAARAAADASLREGLALETGLFAFAASTADMREGTQAFLEKRAPRFLGR